MILGLTTTVVLSAIRWVPLSAILVITVAAGLTLGLIALLRLQHRHRPRDVLRSVSNVELLVDRSRNGLNFSSQFLLDLVEVEAVIPVDEVDSKTKVTKSARTTNTMKVGLSVLGEVKIDNYVDSLDIDTASQEVRTDEVAADTIPEVVENTISVMLQHLRMRVETRVAELCNLLCKQLHPVGGVAKDDRLVDLEFGEEGVQAVYFLLFFNESVVLRDTPEG